MQQSQLSDEYIEQLAERLYNRRNRGVLTVPRFKTGTELEALTQEAEELTYTLFTRYDRVDEYIYTAHYGRKRSNDNAPVQPLEALPPTLRATIEQLQELYRRIGGYAGFEEPELNGAQFNKYPEGSGRIGPHRDYSRDRNLILILTIKGHAKLYTGTGRENKALLEPQLQPNPPGSLVLLRAPRNKSETELRPWHELRRATTEKISLIARAV